LAIEVLAQQLWQQPQVNGALGAVSQNELTAASQPPAAASVGAAGQPTPDTDLAAPPEPRTPLGEALENVRSLIHPLAQRAGVAVQIYITAEIVDLPTPPMALRTILLSALAVAVPIAAPGTVIVAASRRDDAIAVEVTCSQPPEGNRPLTGAELDALTTAQEQAAFYAARLEISGRTRGEFAVTLLLDAPQETVVLVIDDNTDWLALVQRYVAGMPVQVVVTATPEGACALAGKLQPALIVLDVMMHNVDGWQVLSELRHDPATSHIPIVVCTILPLAEMALALGANAFLQKPVSQQQFLQLLDRFGSA
jgi:CheY-like chemotaxis protein